MLPDTPLPLLPAVYLIEMLGAGVILAYTLLALRSLIQSRAFRVEHAQHLMSEGILNALGFKLAATLLKTILLTSWNALMMFTAIFLIRTVLKFFFRWQEAQLDAQLALNPEASGRA